MTEDKETFEQMVLRSWNEEAGAKSFVLFSSPDCAPCRRIKATIESLEDNLGKIVGFINVCHAVAAASQSKVRSVPTLIRFERGQEVARMVGDTSRQKLEAFLRD